MNLHMKLNRFCRNPFLRPYVDGEELCHSDSDVKANIDRGSDTWESQRNCVQNSHIVAVPSGERGPVNSNDWGRVGIVAA